MFGGWGRSNHYAFLPERDALLVMFSIPLTADVFTCRVSLFSGGGCGFPLVDLRKSRIQPRNLQSQARENHEPAGAFQRHDAALPQRRLAAAVSLSLGRATC